jgi:hypothetical protein
MAVLYSITQYETGVDAIKQEKVGDNISNLSTYVP